MRPGRPLVWLIGIVFFATLLRTWRLNAVRRRPPNPQPAGEPPRASAAAREEKPDEAAAPKPTAAAATAPSKPNPAATDPRESLGHSVLTAFALTVAGRPEPSPLRRAELVVYVLLIACILVALANTNPTLRDMIDTIR